MWANVVRMFLVMTCLFIVTSTAQGQMSGSRGGVEDEDTGRSSKVEPPSLTRETVESFITIEGSAEVRVRPTEIRVVLAVTDEELSASECQTKIDQTVGLLKKAWIAMDIPAENIVEDFIAVLPVYEWNLQKRETGEVGVEKRTGFRMQTNLHLQVPNDASASKALRIAFQHNVTDIIAFDYWSKELDESKVKARQEALKAARSKSDQLFTAFFDKPPAPINIQEKTTAHFPSTQYHSFKNDYTENLTVSWRRDIPMFHAFRPKNTYYRGLSFHGDTQSDKLPMNPEISVVSTVRVYFESAAARRPKDTK